MRMTYLGRRALRWAVAAGLCLLAAAPVAAQTTSASVAGQVKDAQGGVLPAATVTLTSKTQANTLTATTDAEGRFVFPIVRPDGYVLRVSMQGFKTLERTTVQVSANDRFFAGILTLEVGAITEEVSVTGRVSELQATSGERSYTMESEVIKNIASNGRALFQFATLVPGVLSQNTAAAPSEGQVSSFTVNGQRPNSNNMTIDGVANIDTGDNGGNMATTNIDAVAEFKILTNAYQAEYGRAVGGQVQVVTKSGTQSFHGSGYWYGRRSDWNANTLDQQAGGGAGAGRERQAHRAGGVVAQRLRLHPRRTHLHPGRLQREQEEALLLLERGVAEEEGPGLQPRHPGAHRPRAGRGLLPEPRQQREPVPLHPRLHDRPAVQRGYATTSGCFQDGGVLGRIPQNRLYANGLAALNIYPLPNFTAGSGVNYTSQVPSDRPRREDLIRLDFQPSDKWRFTGRYMNDSDTELQAYGTTWAGSGSDQLPMPVSHPLPGRNWMLSATGILNTTTSVEVSVGAARNALTYDLQAENLFRSAAGLTSFPYLYPDAPQGDYIPCFQFRGGRTGNAGQYQTNQGPFVNENKTFDALANLTKIWGAHASKFGVYYQHSYKAQSNFASFNSTVNFVDNSSNPYDTGYSYANAATGVFNTYQQANKFAYPEYVYKNFEFYGQDNWKATSRLTVDYGVRFYYMTPQWDQTLQASTFVPDDWSAANAPRLYYPVCKNGASSCSGSNLIGVDPANPANTVEGRFVGRLVQPTTDAQRFNGAYQAGQGINDTMYSGNVFKVSPRLGVVYDLTGEGRTIVRGGFGIFYDRPQGNIVFDTINNAPGLLQPTVQYGLLQNLTGGSNDPYAPLGLTPTAYDFVPPKVTAWNVGVQHKLWKAITLDIAYVGSKNENLIEQEQINALPLGTLFKPENQDPTRAPSSTPGATALTTDLLRPYQGYGSIRWWDATGYSQLPRPPDGDQPPVRQRADVLGLLRLEQDPRNGNTDWSTRIPYSTDEENRRGQLLLRRQRPAAQLRAQLRLPDAQGRERRARPPRERVADLGHLPLDERPAVRHQLVDPGHREQQPHRRHRRHASCRAHLRPGERLERRSLQADRHLVLRPAPGRQHRRRVGPVLPARAADQQPGHVDLQDLHDEEGDQARGAARRLQRAQPHAVHGRQQLRQLREPHRPDHHEPAVRREREPHPEQRLRDHQRGRASAHPPARHPADVLVGATPHRGRRLVQAPAPVFFASGREPGRPVEKWGVPVSEILGGRLRDSVPFASYLFFRYPRPAHHGAEVRTAEQLVAQARALKKQHGFTSHKLKGGVFPLEYELECYRTLADALPGDRFRFDPNGVWSTEPAIWFGQQVEGIGNDYLEDPVSSRKPSTST